ncbi:MAG: DUF255 domain-containing protein [Pedobacter sp.]|nr:MAG: DUF255 domain-containing protein [Pedobacter sp.]
MRIYMYSFKTALAICCLLLSAGIAKAQKGITFQNISFDEAQSKAAKSGKIILVDVTRKMPNDYNLRAEKEVFTIDSIASYINANCIAITMNMDTEEGKAFSPNLHMLMYPAYVFYNERGAQLEYTNAGTILKNPAVMMQKARLSKKNAEIKKANLRSIAFKKDKWADLLALAKKEGKLIFLDAQTEWCRPCRMMERDVFTLDTVADFYNANYINASIDMEKGEGPALNKKYKVTSYPTYLFINGDGEVVHTAGGYTDPAPFIAIGKEALKKGNITEKSQTNISFGAGDWNSQLQRAAKEDKLIFVDCYAVWCGPCKTMDKEVFTQADVAGYFNKSFVNVKLDMEKGEGITIKNKYNVKAYPTFLFINSKGEEVHRLVGSSPAADFLAKAKEASDPAKQLATLNKRYTAGERDVVFLKGYIDALSDAYLSGQAADISKSYLQSLPKAQLLTKESWVMIQKHITNPTDPILAYVLKNKEQLAANLADTSTLDALQKHYSNSIGMLYHSEGEFSAKTEAAILKQIKAAKLPKAKELSLQTKLMGAGKREDWKSFVAVIDEVVKNNYAFVNMPTTAVVTSFSNTLLKQTGKQYTEKVIGWTDQILPQLKNKLDISKVYDLRASVYTEAGDTVIAAAEKKRSDDLVEEWRKESKGTGAMMMVPMKLK